MRPPALFTAPAGPVPDATVTRSHTPRLTDYDVIAVNLSGGKDGLPALAQVAEQADRLGIADRVHTFHADLGPMEWPAVVHQGIRHPGSAELAAIQSAAFDIPAERHHQVRRARLDDTGATVPYDLLTYIAERGRWPWLGQGRFCTSGWKTGEVAAAWTPMIRERRPRRNSPAVRILNVLGLRAEESRDRAARPVYRNVTANTARHVDEWLPVHWWPTDAVRAWNDATGIPHHWTYDSAPGAGDWKGTARCSCSLCVLADKRSLVLGVARRPRLAALYAEVEAVRREPFRRDWSMAHLISLAAAPGAPDPGIVLPDDGPEFVALERAVRAALLLPARSIRADKAADDGPDLFGTCGGCSC